MQQRRLKYRCKAGSGCDSYRCLFRSLGPEVDGKGELLPEEHVVLNKTAGKEDPIKLVNLRDQISDLTDVIRDHLHQRTHYVRCVELRANIACLRVRRGDFAKAKMERKFISEDEKREGEAEGEAHLLAMMSLWRPSLEYLSSSSP